MAVYDTKSPLPPGLVSGVLFFGVVIAGSATAVMLVTSARGGTRRRIRRALGLLRQTEAPLVGVILNRAGKGSGIEWESPVQPLVESQNGHANGRLVRL